MVVIKYQGDRFLEFFDVVAKNTCQLIGPWQGSRLQILGGLGTATRVGATQRCDNVRQELNEVAVRCVQRQPG